MIAPWASFWWIPRHYKYNVIIFFNSKFHLTIFYDQNSLSILLELLNLANPHFVRCVKPNTTKAPKTFQDKFVTAQVRERLTSIKIIHSFFINKPTGSTKLNYVAFQGLCMFMIFFSWFGDKCNIFMYHFAIYYSLIN